MFAENTIKIVASAYFKMKRAKQCQKSWVKTWSKVASKLCPSMLRKIIGPSFDSKKGIFIFFLQNFLKIAFSLQKEKLKRKKRRKLGPSFNSKNGYFWTKFWLYSAYIYIHTYIYIDIYICLMIALLPTFWPF